MNTEEYEHMRKFVGKIEDLLSEIDNTHITHNLKFLAKAQMDVDSLFDTTLSIIDNNKPKDTK